MTIKWVQQDPLVMNGEPFCYGSRLTVRQLLELRANGYDLTRILTDHPELKTVGVAAAFTYAADHQERYADFFEADGTLTGPGFSDGRPPGCRRSTGCRGSSSRPRRSPRPRRADRAASHGRRPDRLLPVLRRSSAPGHPPRRRGRARLRRGGATAIPPRRPSRPPRPTRRSRRPVVLSPAEVAQAIAVRREFGLRADRGLGPAPSRRTRTRSMDFGVPHAARSSVTRSMRRPTGEEEIAGAVAGVPRRSTPTSRVASTSTRRAAAS